MLTGNDLPNAIDGGGDNGGHAGDTLNGLGGNDTLHTNNPFRSTLNGGAGDDHCSPPLAERRRRRRHVARWSGGHPRRCNGHGRPGIDTVDYGTWARFEPITVTLDDVANDGAPGLGDNVASDVENVRGGGGQTP